MCNVTMKDRKSSELRGVLDDRMDSWVYKCREIVVEHGGGGGRPRKTWSIQ